MDSTRFFILLLLNWYQSALQVVAWVYLVLFLFVLKSLSLTRKVLSFHLGADGAFESPISLVVCDVCQSLRIHMEIPFALREFYILPGYFKAGSV